jgi:transposase
MVMVLGVDVHKKTHTAVAVDGTGRRLAEKTVPATDAGHQRLLRWAGQLAGGTPAGQELHWAVEDCRHVSGRLERALLSAGQAVIRVPPKLMAGARTAARTRGKSDPIDALAIARAALREPDLPVARHDDQSRRLKLLVDRREDLVAERTRAQNRLRWHLHELDPDLDPPAGSLDRPRQLDQLTTWLTDYQHTHTDEILLLVAELAAEIVTDIRALTSRITALHNQIAALAGAAAPGLLALPGCGALTAAKIVAETAGVTRFATEAKYAMHAGVAPIPASSGKTNRHRLARGGNRQLNAALHRIAFTQIRLNGPGTIYYQRRRANGDTHMEALRALKRRLARTVFTTLHHAKTATPPEGEAAA